MGIARTVGRLGAVVFLLLPAWEPAAAQDTLRLSLPDAVRRALEESEEIAGARAWVTQADARVAVASSAMWPRLGTSLTYNRAIRTVFDAAGQMPPADTTRIPDAYDTSLSPYDRYDVMSELVVQDMLSALFAGLPFGRRNTYIAGLSLAQPLFAGGAIRGGISLAQHGRTAAELALEEAEGDLALQVHTAYLNVVLTRQLVGIAQEGMRIAAQHLRQVAAFQARGTVSEFDFLRARVELENRLPELLRIQNAAHLAELDLKRVVNLPPDAVLVLTTDQAPPQVQVDEAEVRRLVRLRPALEAAREAVAMGEAGVQLAGAGRWPSVQLIGNMGFQAYPSNVLPPGYGEWRSDWSVAVGLSWAPFDGFQTRARVAEAQAQLRQAHLQERQLEEALDLQAEAALGEYRSAAAQARARRETVLMAERALRLAEVRYESGLATQLDVSDAALLLDQARVNEVQAVHDYVKALATLERLTGGRLGLLTDRTP